MRRRPARVAHAHWLAVARAASVVTWTAKGRLRGALFTYSPEIGATGAEKASLNSANKEADSVSV